eukprot:CAMPEP_0172178156 /NCGR_PEP_ID=MMETSP1050-20130122/15862_1 /TAXON_ID=233186 /ORGANISM="Cryptomonas curvata, Strain CCAP979/52" /LENGTH=446 /DNA_ID=CAMNT_0012850809 /DNA_START=8 /DNA_END=1345 /DNA_ORIENTATION=+
MEEFGDSGSLIRPLSLGSARGRKRAREVALVGFSFLALVGTVAFVVLSGSQPHGSVHSQEIVELLGERQDLIRSRLQFQKDVQQVGSVLMKGLRDSELPMVSGNRHSRIFHRITKHRTVLDSDNSSAGNETTPLSCEDLLQEDEDSCDSYGNFHSADENRRRRAVIAHAEVNKARAYRASQEASESSASAHVSASIAAKHAVAARLAAEDAEKSYETIAARTSPSPDEQSLLRTAGQQASSAKTAYSKARSAATEAEASAALAERQSIAAEVAAQIADAAFNTSEEDLTIQDVLLQARTVQTEADKADSARRTASDAAAHAALMQEMAETAADGAASAQTAAGAFVGYQDARAVRTLSPDLLRWMQSSDGLDWLDSCAGWQWLSTKEGAGWLGAYDGSHWLQTPHGARFLQSQEAGSPGVGPAAGCRAAPRPQRWAVGPGGVAYAR